VLSLSCEVRDEGSHSSSLAVLATRGGKYGVNKKGYSPCVTGSPC
jgi:hypothetical protein